MPWKRCPNCHQLSYSAATTPIRWECPHCRHDLTLLPETNPNRQEIEEEFLKADSWREWVQKGKEPPAGTPGNADALPDTPAGHER